MDAVTDDCITEVLFQLDLFMICKNSMATKFDIFWEELDLYNIEEKKYPE